MPGVIWILIDIGVLIAVGNLAILGLHLRARGRERPREAAWAGGAPNAHEVTPRLWRSGRPTAETYAAATAAGAATFVDLRAEADAGRQAPRGRETHHLPIRDGQPPDPETVERFLEIVASADQPVLVHCSAGVGRTGSLVAVYRVVGMGWKPRAALRELLTVGPPSLEQIDFVLGLPERRRPRVPALALSRVLDAPRRTWSRLKAFLR
jgi:protein-tyrosine phosphatase